MSLPQCRPGFQGNINLFYPSNCKPNVHPNFQYFQLNFQLGLTSNILWIQVLKDRKNIASQPISFQTI